MTTTPASPPARLRNRRSGKEIICRKATTHPIAFWCPRCKRAYCKTCGLPTYALTKKKGKANG